MQAGYDNGADYFYQINDDVKMKTPNWESTFTSQLQTTKGFGVTGPTDESNTRILTQTFTHRTHLQIFDQYFPDPFRNWWSDDWLSEVYSGCTFRSHGIMVQHQTSNVGQRYPVHEAAGALRTEVMRGQEKIRAWLKVSGRTSDAARCFA